MKRCVWRWGVSVPRSVEPPAHEDHFRGFYNDRANAINGAPLIPGNQSLRIKVGQAYPIAVEDNAKPPVGPKLLDSVGPGKRPAQVAVWYAATLRTPANRVYSQFFGHGFALAYSWQEARTAGLTALSYSDLLDAPSFAPCYHDFRWHPKTHGQRVPSAFDNAFLDASGRSKLSLNRLGIGAHPISEDLLP